MAPVRGGSSGSRSRNFSRITGYRMFTYEYDYEGPLFKKLISRCNIYLRVAEDTLDSYSKFQPSLFHQGPTDGTFELFSVLSVQYSLEDLSESVFISFDDEKKDLREVLKRIENNGANKARQAHEINRNFQDDQ